MSLSKRKILLFYYVDHQEIFCAKVYVIDYRWFQNGVFG